MFYVFARQFGALSAPPPSSHPNAVNWDFNEVLLNILDIPTIHIQHNNSYSCFHSDPLDISFSMETAILANVQYFAPTRWLALAQIWELGVLRSISF